MNPLEQSGSAGHRGSNRTNDHLAWRFGIRFLAIWAMLTALLALILWLLYRTQLNAALAIAHTQQRQAVLLASQIITSELDVLGGDALYLAELLALQEWLANDKATAHRRASAELLAFAKHRQRYDQIRVLDEQGRERVRVNWRDGRPELVPPAALQDKSGRDYVQQSLDLARGQLYASRFDLNIEHGEIEQPPKPVLRIATPIFDSQGGRHGVMLLNYLGQRLLERIRAVATQEAEHVWLLNARGYWLLGPRPEDEWGFIYPERRDISFANRYADAWSLIKGGPAQGQFMHDDALYSYIRVAPAALLGNRDHADMPATNSWLLLTRVPAAALADQSGQQARNLGIAFLLLTLLLAAITWRTVHHQRRRRQVEQEVRRSEARFRGLLESAPDGIVIVDRQGAVTLINNQAEKWFGYDRAELLGEPIEVLVPQRFRGQHRNDRNGYLRAPAMRPMGAGLELYGRRKDGSEFPVEISLSPLQTDQGTLITAIVRDISARQQIESDIRRLNEALSQRAAALEAINRELESFSYSVSHDLRAPLRAIDGFSRILLDEYGERLDENGRDRLQRICAAAQKMGLLIDDLLMLSRVTRAEVKRERVDLSRLAGEVLDELRKAEPARAVAATVQPGLYASGDARLLRIVLDNLLGNAWKFTARRDAARIEFGATLSDGRPTYFVRDNGAGFDMAYADKLFGAFQRLHDSREFPGTGIGLATVQRIIRKHGGRVWADSTPDQGTTFYFTLQQQDAS